MSAAASHRSASTYRAVKQPGMTAPSTPTSNTEDQGPHWGQNGEREIAAVAGWHSPVRGSGEFSDVAHDVSVRNL